jgi:peptidoglycan hydrolase-like protein with peptidoglycan-binding domain
MALDLGSLTKLALSLISKREELMGIVSDALGLWKKVQSALPGLVDQLSGLTGKTAAGSTDTYSIRWLQESLNKLINAGLTVDGHYGQATQDAVKKFQRANGLVEDGWAGVQTQAKIVEALG